VRVFISCLPHRLVRRCRWIPMNNFLPSGSVTSPPLALLEPSLARNP
jgi:hypothetical protein